MNTDTLKSRNRSSERSFLPYFDVHPSVTDYGVKKVGRGLGCIHPWLIGFWNVGIALKSGGRWMWAWIISKWSEKSSLHHQRSLSFASVTWGCIMQHAVVLKVIFFAHFHGQCSLYKVQVYIKVSWHISKCKGCSITIVSCMSCFTDHSLHFPLQSCWENNVPSHQSSEAEFPSCPSLDSQPSISLAAAWWATAREPVSIFLSLSSISFSILYLSV